MTKRADLLASLGVGELDATYLSPEPSRGNRLSLRLLAGGSAYLSWPMVTELCGHQPVYGLNENRRSALISIDKGSLIERVKAYLNPAISDSEAAQICGGLMKMAARFDPQKCRKRALSEHAFDPANVRRFTSSPFDVHWCYWSPVRPMWNEPRPDLVEQHWPGNAFLHVRRFGRKSDEGHSVHYGSALPDLHLMDPDIVSIPLRWRSKVMGAEDYGANVSEPARRYLAGVGIPNVDSNPESAKLIWHHVIAISYSPEWLAENGSAIRTGFPRFPLPAKRERLLAPAELGRQVAALLEVDYLVEGVTIGAIRPELRTIAVASRVGGGALDPAKGELALAAGWGFSGKGGITMAGKGRIETRAESQLPAPLGTRMHDVFLNSAAYWRNVPEKVWDFTIGGYQVMKKWLSYRERTLLGRDLTMDEVDYFTQMARRIAAILLLSEQLDENYRACRDEAYAWESNGSPSGTHAIPQPGK